MPHSFSNALFLRALMDNIADSIYFKDRECRLLRVSRKMAEDLGFSNPEELVGKTDSDLFGEEFGQKTAAHDQWVMETGEPIIGLIESRRLPDGELNWTSTTKLPVRDQQGEVIGLLGITREVNELIQNSMEMQYLATHDPLTRLPNRFLVYDRLQQMMAHASRYDMTFAVLFVDLDGFKRINDTYGHDCGDLLLKQIGERMLRGVRDTDTVARLGGDEFLIILDAVDHFQVAEMIAGKVLDELDQPFSVCGQETCISISIGISLYPQHGRDIETLIRAADQAMYAAKRQGRHVTTFTSFEK
ncbi:MAG: GGDEF domain-containing protein [Chloroflexota bacterium]